jgi:hypothetical protein
MTNIGTYAFYNCGPIGTLTIETGSILSAIRQRAFQGCTFTGDSLTIPKTVTVIELSAFYNCGTIGSLTFETGGTTLTIGSNAFQGSKITGGLIIPKTVTSIGIQAFFNCGNIGSLTFETGAAVGKTLTIGSQAFQNSTFTGGLIIPKTVTSIGSYAFYNCGTVGSLTFETGGTTLTIISNAFNLPKFTGDLTIPSTVTSIGSQAFINCGFGTSAAPANLYINCTQLVYNTAVTNNAFAGCFFNAPIFSS